MPKHAERKDSGVVGRPGPSPTYGPLPGPDLAGDPFPGPSLSPGNLQTRPTGPNRTLLLFLFDLWTTIRVCIQGLIMTALATPSDFVKFARDVLQRPDLTEDPRSKRGSARVPRPPHATRLILANFGVRLEPQWPFLDLLVVTAGFYGSES